MSDPFVHLHVHTEFSILDGAARLDDLVRAALEDGAPAISSTDHGNLYAGLEFYKKCNKAGLKYVPGTEIYMAAESVDERPARGASKLDDGGGSTDEGKKLYYHATLLAETNEGFSNLIKASSDAFLHGYYYKPRVDWEMLSKYARGVIATSGCLGGVILQDLMRDNVQGARKNAGKFQEIYGRDNFFIELQDHGLPEQTKTNPMLIDLAKFVGAPLLATNDSHYVARDNHTHHDALLCVQTSDLLSNPNRFHFNGEEHYLKTANEMRWLFRDFQDACDNTLWIAERSNVTMDMSGYKLPRFDCPPEYESPEAYLRHLTYEGAFMRWGTLTPEIEARLDYELECINSMGFTAYFLILWDIVAFAKWSGIKTGPGRGSAAGSAVCYALAITAIDPIEYDLIFERFLNPSRISMPDIDLDMDSRYRDTMIKYAASKYGDDRVAQIITFGQIKSRSAVRDATRVMGGTWTQGDLIVKTMPPVVMGRETPLSACLEFNPAYADGYAQAAEFRALYNTDPEVQKIVDVAKGLEGLRRNDGIHAAAVVISDKPLTDYMPIQRKPLPNGGGVMGPIVTQYEMHNVEELGLLKMDFLALRNLDTIDIAERSIKEREPEFNVDLIPIDDPATFELFRSGNTIGVFQLESSKIRELLVRMEPTSYHDIAAVVALYRPGPMASDMHLDYADRKNGRQSVTTFHPDAEEVLETTQGLMIYQESMMRIAQKFGGYSLAEADNLRKATGKKDRELMRAERDKFVPAVISQGYDESLANHIWEMIEPFADYSFNKSHAYGYGYVAYQTAYLKANYPVEYLAALLTSNANNAEKTAVFLNECKRMGIQVLPPSVNESMPQFLPHHDRIRFGFDALKGIGPVVVQNVIDSRADRKFSNFFDFCDRMVGLSMNKVAIGALINSGGCDEFHKTRRSMIEGISTVQEANRKRIKAEAKGMLSLFELPPIEIDDCPEYEKKELLTREKEALGVYLSDHPLNAIKKMYDEDYNVVFVADMDENIGRWCSFYGILVKVEKKKTKRGDYMAFATFEDITGTTEIIIFPKLFREVEDVLVNDNIVHVNGRIDLRDEGVKINVQSIKLIET